MSTRYRLARPLAARIVGAALVTASLVVMVATVVAVGAGASLGTLLAVAGVVVAVALGVAIGVTRGWSVLTLDDEGYRLRWRAAGVRAASWVEIDDASATYAGEEPVVLLRLRDGRRTVVPVRLLDVDREQLVNTLQEHLQRGHRIRRL